MPYSGSTNVKWSGGYVSLPDRLKLMSPADGRMLNAAASEHVFNWSEVPGAIEDIVTITMATNGAMDFIETTKTNRLSAEPPGNCECTWRVAPRFPDDSIWPDSGIGRFTL